MRTGLVDRAAEGPKEGGKKDKLQVLYEILRDSPIKYPKAVKTAKFTYFFLDLIEKNSRALFSTINVAIRLIFPYRVPGDV